MSTQMRGSTTALIALFVVAGCATSSAPTSVPTGAPTPTVAVPTMAPTFDVTAAPISTPSPSPAPDLKAEAASAYLAAVTAHNSALDAIRKKPCGVSTLKAQHNCVRKWSTAVEAWNAAILAIVFPPEYAADAHALVKANAEVDALLRSEIGEKSLSRIFNYWDPKLDKATEKARAASSLLRAELGLPPVPIK